MVEKEEQEKKNEEGGREVKNEEEQKKEEKGASEEQPDQEIVLKVDMHCQACAKKIARALKGVEGVKDVRADSQLGTVVMKVKSYTDPEKVSQRIQKKSGRKVQIISPLPNPAAAQETNKPAEPTEAKKEEQRPPPDTTAVLKVRMHCEACAQVLTKRIRKMQGVESVTADLANDKVIITGILDPQKLVDQVYKRTRKRASIVKVEAEKDEEKKEEEKTGGEGGGENIKAGEDQKGGEVGKIEAAEDQKSEVKRSQYWPPTYPMEYVQEQYAYTPQFFSDENPNSCSVM